MPAASFFQNEFAFFPAHEAADIAAMGPDDHGGEHHAQRQEPQGGKKGKPSTLAAQSGYSKGGLAHDISERAQFFAVTAVQRA